MNYLRITGLLGILMIAFSVAMLTGLFWSIPYEESHATFALAVSAAMTAVVGAAMWWSTRQHKGTIMRREAFLLVSLSWLLLGIFGSLPFLLAGTFSNPADAFFETVSGLTATGATVITNLEDVPLSIHWWRCLMQWMGGMGIIVLFVAVFPQLGVGGKVLFRNEMSGPPSGTLTPKIKETAAALWWIYFALTSVLIIILLLCGMNLHDAMCHAFTTLATAGFSPHSESTAYFRSALIDWVLILFMILGAVNFTIYYQIVKKRLRAAITQPELKVFLLIALGAGALVTLDLWTSSAEKYENFLDAARYGFFQTTSMLTTTGYATDDFNQYPSFSRVLLLTLMLIGGMAGSTAGGVKVIRVMVVMKAIYLEIYRTFRPQAVTTLKIGKRTLPQEQVQTILAFFAMVIIGIILATLYLTFIGMDLISAGTAVMATLLTIGPGLERVGAIESFAYIPSSGKVLLSFCMIVGRLEYLTILVLFLPDYWRR